MVYSPDMSGGSSESYSGLEPTDLGDITQHPAHNLPEPGQQPVGPRDTKMAGEVIPMIRNEAYSGQNGVINATARLSQHLNDSAMKDIAARGPSSVDTTNLAKRIIKP